MEKTLAQAGTKQNLTLKTQKAQEAQTIFIMAYTLASFASFAPLAFKFLARPL